MIENAQKFKEQITPLNCFAFYKLFSLRFVDINKKPLVNFIKFIGFKLYRTNLFQSRQKYVKYKKEVGKADLNLHKNSTHLNRDSVICYMGP